MKRGSWRMALAAGLMCAETMLAQSIRLPWSGFAHEPQHGGVSAVASQPLNRILWSVPVDLAPGTVTHYGSPLVTRSNTIIVPVKTGLQGGFYVEALAAATGATNWTQATDYIVPPHNWVPCCGPGLTPRNRLYVPGAGGTVYYCDTPDSAAPPTFHQIAFFGLTNYMANTNSFNTNVFICTPITSDRYGNIFFGFQTNGGAPLGLRGGIARIDFDGAGSWVSALAASDFGLATKAALNSAPALSLDERTLYAAVNGPESEGCLIALDSRTLAPLASVRLKDALVPANYANVDDDSTASPTVAPDGDVYLGVLASPNSPNNDNRGWLLHFSGDLRQTKIPGAFGWDATAAVVSPSLVSSYHGASPYLLMVKYNDYSVKIYRIAILDPRQFKNDPVTDVLVMAEVITALSPLGKEWCINAAAVDPFTKSILVNNEDGRLYRWDLSSNILSQAVDMTAGSYQAYTPTVIGMDGIVYGINNARLYAVGR